MPPSKMHELLLLIPLGQARRDKHGRYFMIARADAAAAMRWRRRRGKAKHFYFLRETEGRERERESESARVRERDCVFFRFFSLFSTLVLRRAPHFFFPFPPFRPQLLRL